MAPHLFEPVSASPDLHLVGLLASRPQEKTSFGSTEAPESLPVEVGADHIVPLNPESGALTVEPSVAIRDSIIVVSWNDSRGGHIKRGFYDVGSAISVDRGMTFRSLGFLPESSDDYIGGGDSRVIVDNKGVFYIEVVTLHDSRHELLVYALRPPNYANWQFVATVARGKEMVDKPAFVVDRSDNLALAFTLDRAIVYASSHDGGASWTQPIRVSNAAPRHRSGEGVAVCGSYIHVSWMEGGGLLLDEVWSVESRDGGKTFSEPAFRFGLTQTIQPPKGFALGPGPAGDLQNDVAVSCLPRDWRRQGAVLLTLDGFRDSSGRPLSRVLSFERRLGGSVELPPTEVTASDGDALRVFPSVASTSRAIAMLYYEVRAEPSQTPVNVVIRIVDEVGRQARVRLTDAPTDWLAVKGDMEFAPGQHNFGDYISVASDGTQFVAAWTDGREGRSRIHVRIVTPK
jgi:hypothetical protein